MQRAALPLVTGYAGSSNGLHRPLQRATFSDVPESLKNRTFFFLILLLSTAVQHKLF